eukprot:GHVO01063863.1.p1 GENE.GHVO01063863.1~~GHVO01063863.1.p1  ORF type:complete len:557 (+),score=78.86 GHVO01063863.1:336-2006(+)
MIEWRKVVEKLKTGRKTRQNADQLRDLEESEVAVTGVVSESSVSQIAGTFSLVFGKENLLPPDGRWYNQSYCLDNKRLKDLGHADTTLAPSTVRFSSYTDRLATDSGGMGKVEAVEVDENRDEGNNKFGRALKNLQLNSMPQMLMCRDNEWDRIYNFLEGPLKNKKSGGALYISGMPGTGKTATVTAVISDLQSDAKIPDFTCVTINGMDLPNANAVYRIMCDKIMTRKSKSVPSAQISYTALNKYFNNSQKRQACLVVIDEVDALITSKQHVMYSLFEWPLWSTSLLSVIAIANTMDLPERLMPRCASRIGFNRLNFFPYTRENIERIIVQRLYDTNGLFKPDAIELCARKVASVSGDIRRALHISRKALERSRGKHVEISDVVAAVEDINKSPYSVAVSRLALIPQLLLLALVIEIKRNTEDEPIPLFTLKDRVNPLLSTSGEFPIGFNLDAEGLIRVCLLLRNLNIIQIDQKSPMTFMRKSSEIVKTQKSPLKKAKGRIGEKEKATGVSVEQLASYVDEIGGDVVIRIVPQVEDVQQALCSSNDIARQRLEAL